MALKKWELLAVVAKKLAEWNPKEPGFFVELAYASGSLATKRYVHTVTLLPNGKVLLAGGYGSGPLASSELYEP